MRIAVFGATGRSGGPLVTQAIAAGHDVVAFVRDRARLPEGLIRDAGARILVVEGDVCTAADVERMFVGAPIDAVVSALGPAKGAPDDLMSSAARTIVAAMQSAGVPRLVWMTGAGVDGDGDEPKLINHAIKGALKLLGGKVLAQSEAAAATVRSSGLRWTVVRVPMLVDGEPTGSYRVGRVGVGTGSRLVRADGATFLLRVVEEASHIGESPVVSN